VEAVDIIRLLAEPVVLVEVVEVGTLQTEVQV
jgi:hypothetical protein